MNSAGTTGAPRISLYPSKSLLFAYRAAVDELVREVRGRQAAGPGRRERMIAAWLQVPEIQRLLAWLDEGADTAAAGITGEAGRYRPNARSSAADLATFTRILLLSQIDAVWWGGTAPFARDADVLGSAELVDLAPLRSRGVLKFGYRAQPAGLPGRARDWVQHRFVPAFRPRVAGLRFTRSRPVMIALVNQVAQDFAAAMPPRTPRIWVNSLVRSVAHQHHLRSLGYSAALPSAHCTGYACDLEGSWFRRFDPGNVLPRLLFERQAAGQLNVIDEGRTWHLCLHPDACDRLQAVYDGQLRTR